MIYVSRQELKELLQNPLFVAYAPNGGKTRGGKLNGQMYWLRRGK